MVWYRNMDTFELRADPTVGQNWLAWVPDNQALQQWADTQQVVRDDRFHIYRFGDGSWLAEEAWYQTVEEMRVPARPHIANVGRLVIGDVVPDVPHWAIHE